MADHARIDVHHHLLPPEYVRWLRSRGVRDAGGRDLPDWSVERALDLMGQQSIATAVLSVSTPGVHLGGDREARDMALRVNEFAAECVRDRPDRFGFFASVPLPDVDGALDAVAYAFDELSADGVVLLANNRGTYLGAEEFEPLMAELDRRAAVVLVHPAELPGPPAPGIPPFAADFLLDTTRAAVNLVRQGVPGRHPRIRFVLAHAGGFVPYAAHRLALSLVPETGRDPVGLLEDFRSFFFDTALSASPVALPSLLAFARPGHVLFGSDWPFAPDPAVAYFTYQLDAYEGLDPERRAEIDHGSARGLFPRLA
ncbi:putative metal-dependent hydrolase, TIM-barrel fold [Streptoalloteichus tenebrarius]|uniref:Metal-dependent hydrolase, TIM-barrel fold n=1 Tax=Streptoalloteichus tenebrarius (strain ATCC 17920 / DSM 40477 / JCM 4838 / CBS 697.72 / NBRC 16177 / NCIMB 11028 / NRRL B-12390 / A12253. 1 / ISP 5477) TaxID=1933 RepID=A0ABT1HWV5_STRSD|nr:amidohydrolase family protein [Streptoalloteichus tenebrarius]MCP2259989.1 putative metal-dependent hydrolase, TIM-barrel fold [Streptoalloteichus tenebrarius]BFF03898.1 amidohydrolase family protein [Streptoalloteichus tenebrarius]